MCCKPAGGVDTGGRLPALAGLHPSVSQIHVSSQQRITSIQFDQHVNGLSEFRPALLYESWAEDALGSDLNFQAC